MFGTYGFLRSGGQRRAFDLEEERSWERERAIDMQPDEVKPITSSYIRMMEEIWEQIGDKYS